MRRLVVLLAATIAVSSCSGASSTPAAPSTPVTPAPSPAPAPTPTPPLRDPAQFNQTFWNEFAHNGFDAPPGTEPLRRLTIAPMLYLKTVDEAGQPIDAFTLQTVEDAMRAVAPTWGGGQFGLAGVQRGTSTMEGVSGWVTVKWPSPSLGATCGRSTIGTDGGFVQLNYLNTNCSCGGSSRVYPRLARHELGHAFGYWHTDSGSDVMYGQTITSALDCSLSPSPREIYHAQLAYQTPVGTTSALSRSPIIITE